MVMKGDVILVNFPFTDLSQTKLRPAIILWIDPVGNDSCRLCNHISKHESTG